MKIDSDYRNYKCAFCGKEFSTFYPDKWVYKTEWKKRKLYCCSWSCLRAVNTSIWGNPNGFIVDYAQVEKKRKDRERKRKKRKQNAEAEYKNAGRQEG